VALRVCHSGKGVEPAPASVFEPFFTTRPAGEGTGLGSSFAFGAVEQTGGHVQSLTR
jgi:C4-dicarboxylate-specific signal transduction histidine kinase